MPRGGGRCGSKWGAKRAGEDSGFVTRLVVLRRESSKGDGPKCNRAHDAFGQQEGGGRSRRGELVYQRGATGKSGAELGGVEGRIAKSIKGDSTEDLERRGEAQGASGNEKIREEAKNREERGSRKDILVLTSTRVDTEGAANKKSEKRPPPGIY